MKRMWRISSKNEIKRNYLKKRFLATAAVFALVMCICQIQPVKASVERFISYITYHVTILNKDGSKEKIEMKEGFLSISENAPKMDMFLDSVNEAGTLAGIDLLDSAEAYSYKGCVKYNPRISEDGDMYGIAIIDNLYAIGDLENTKIHPKEKEEDCCTALFVYKGVEYLYMGGVSHDTMKAFLNTLE